MLTLVLCPCLSSGQRRTSAAKPSLRDAHTLPNESMTSSSCIWRLLFDIDAAQVRGIGRLHRSQYEAFLFSASAWHVLAISDTIILDEPLLLLLLLLLLLMLLQVVLLLLVSLSGCAWCCVVVVAVVVILMVVVVGGGGGGLVSDC